MSATVVSLPKNNTAETIDFLRRMASMLAGGKNGETLLQAASMIEQLSRRATSAEQLYHRQQEESVHNVELRELAEIAGDRLLSEVDALKAQLVASTRQADIERTQFAEEACRLIALTQDAEARLVRLNAELDELRQPAETPAATEAEVVTVPVRPLQLARAQFLHLADGFAKSGDVISQTICEIGRCAIDQALEGGEPDETA